MSFLLYELALNPNIQEKLAEEIKETDRKNKGFDYNSIQHMKYMDMVVSGKNFMDSSKIKTVNYYVIFYTKIVLQKFNNVDNNKI